MPEVRKLTNDAAWRPDPASFSTSKVRLRMNSSPNFLHTELPHALICPTDYHVFYRRYTCSYLILSDICGGNSAAHRRGVEVA